MGLGYLLRDSCAKVEAPIAIIAALAAVAAQYFSRQSSEAAVPTADGVEKTDRRVGAYCAASPRGIANWPPVRSLA